MALVTLIVGYILYISANFDSEYFTKVLPVLSMIVIVAYKTMTQLSRLLVNRMAVEQYLPSMKLVNEMIAQSSIPSKTDRIETDVQHISFDTIRFQNVDFAYDEDADVLSNVTFDITSGQTTVLMGPSGSGKSTIIDLLLGLYSPNSGSVLLDDRDLDRIDLETWRKHIGYVGQDVFLFHESIENNIRIGQPDISSEQVKEVTKRVGLHDFIRELPNGYDTEVGDRGAMLSGGQRQRISIARALYSNLTF